MKQIKGEGAIAGSEGCDVVVARCGRTRERGLRDPYAARSVGVLRRIGVGSASSGE